MPDAPAGPAAAAAAFGSAGAAYDGFMGRCSPLFVPALLDAAGIAPGARVLDVATGTGAAALAALERVGPQGRVIGVDLAIPMLQVAVARGRARGLRVAVMDGQALGWRDGTFDAVLCQLGLMFFPDLARGLSEFRRVLRPGGVVGAMVWSAAERMTMMGPLCRALERRRPAERDTLRTTFRLAEPGSLAAALAGAGFRDVGVAPATRTVVFDSVDAYLAAFQAGAGAVRPIYLQLSDGERREVVAEVSAALAGHVANGALHLPVEGLIAVARA
jgi:SAM-dependent methyltransferase